MNITNQEELLKLTEAQQQEFKKQFDGFIKRLKPSGQSHQVFQVSNRRVKFNYCETTGITITEIEEVTPFMASTFDEIISTGLNNGMITRKGNIFYIGTKRYLGEAALIKALEKLTHAKQN